jgi:hypothetical protein
MPSLGIRSAPIIMEPIRYEPRREKKTISLVCKEHVVLTSVVNDLVVLEASDIDIAGGKEDHQSENHNHSGADGLGGFKEIPKGGSRRDEEICNINEVSKDRYLQPQNNNVPVRGKPNKETICKLLSGRRA